MKDTIVFSDLETWANNHETNLEKLPFKSLSAAISLKELNAFILEATQKHSTEFDAVKIYFVRYKFKPNVVENQIEKAKAGDNLSQVSLVIVPAEIKDRKQWIVKELKDKSDAKKILALCVCDPDNDPITDETGMCPPKCPGT